MYPLQVFQQFIDVIFFDESEFDEIRNELFVHLIFPLLRIDDGDLLRLRQTFSSRMYSGFVDCFTIS